MKHNHEMQTKCHLSLTNKENQCALSNCNICRFFYLYLINLVYNTVDKDHPHASSSALGETLCNIVLKLHLDFLQLILKLVISNRIRLCVYIYIHTIGAFNQEFEYNGRIHLDNDNTKLMKYDKYITNN